MASSCKEEGSDSAFNNNIEVNLSDSTALPSMDMRNSELQKITNDRTTTPIVKETVLELIVEKAPNGLSAAFAICVNPCVNPQ